MGVIQAGVNQAIGAAGQAAGYVKFLGNQKKIGEDVQKAGSDVRTMRYYEPPKVEKTPQMSKEEYEIAKEAEVEKAWEIAKQREARQRQMEQALAGDRQSTIQKLRNLKELKERDALRNSPLGGGLNG